MLIRRQDSEKYPGVGAFDREITVQQLTEAVGDDGGTTPTWTTLATVWAHREDVSGEERFRGGQNASPFETWWTLHYREDCDPEQVDVPKLRRVRYLGRNYDVIFARVVGRADVIELGTLASGAAS